MKYLKEGKWKEDLPSGIRIADDITTDTAFTDKTQNDLMSLEDHSWWFIYRADVITRLMDNYYSKDIITIDIGGGNGFTSSVAKRKGYYTGLIEPNLEACRHARSRGIDEISCGTVSEDYVEDSSIEQGLLLDVLEHIKDDSYFLKLLNKMIMRGGTALSQYLLLCASGAAKMMQPGITADTG